MSGHSHWSGIKHKKAVVDAKRGKIFSKVAKLIMQAARDGADPEYNIKLRHAIEKAKSYNMPNDKIDNAVKKGSGQLEGYSLEESVFEAYGPGGVAILIETLTDNKKRTTPEIRHMLEKRNGSLAGPNSVSWKFSAKGLCSVSGVDMPEDEFLELLMDAGMDDYEKENDEYEVYCELEDFENLKAVLTEHNFNFKAQMTKVPNTTLMLDEEQYRKILPLMEDLEDHDDVQEVYADFDVSDEVMQSVENS